MKTGLMGPWTLSPTTSLGEDRRGSEVVVMVHRPYVVRTLYRHRQEHDVRRKSTQHAVAVRSSAATPVCGHAPSLSPHVSRLPGMMGPLAAQRP